MTRWIERLRNTRSLAAAIAGGTLFLAVTAAAAPVPIVINDTTAGGPIWNRPVAGNPPAGLSGVGTAVRYDVNSFSIDTTGVYVIQSVATNPANWDNFSFLYQNAFSAATPLINVLVGNDDNPTIGLSGFTRALTAGVTYFFVESGFSNTDFGAYTVTISAAPTAVPEPGTIALMGIALAAVGVARRRVRGD